MKFLILAENTNYKCDCWPYLHFRGLEPYELRKRLDQRNIPSTIIEWFSHWSKDQLKVCIDSWFKGEEFPVIAISTPYAQGDIPGIRDLLLQARKQYPNLKIIHTGSRTYNESLKDVIDVFFLSRSMEMFDNWLDNKNLDLYKKHNNPLVLVNDFVKDAVDNPILPVVNDSDCLTDKDVIGFELGIGCRFNCTFCNYELRNTQTTNLTTSKELSNFLEQCYQKYGITNFYTADDTINESDEKLVILAEAVEQLSFKPNISCFVRLDVLTARPHQMDLLERIQFFSIFFGIESFNNNASKQVRKKSSIGNVYATLEELKKRCPETFTAGGLIVGLNGDSRESIIESTELVIKNHLLDSIQAYPLSITKSTSISDKDFQSDIDTNPDKFNYKTKKIKGLLHRDNPSTEVYHWESNWIDLDGASMLCGEILNMCEGRVFNFNHWEYLRASSLGLVQNKTLPLSWRDHCQNLSEKFKKNYISEKLKQFK
jgi:lipoate synthase